MMVFKSLRRHSGNDGNYALNTLYIRNQKNVKNFHCYFSEEILGNGLLLINPLTFKYFFIFIYRNYQVISCNKYLAWELITEDDTEMLCLSGD